MNKNSCKLIFLLRIQQILGESNPVKSGYFLPDSGSGLTSQNCRIPEPDSGTSLVFFAPFRYFWNCISYLEMKRSFAPTSIQHRHNRHTTRQKNRRKTRWRNKKGLPKFNLSCLNHFEKKMPNKTRQYLSRHPLSSKK